MMKKLNLIIIILFVTLSLLSCLHREKPKLPGSAYYVRYFEECTLRLQCAGQLNKEEITNKKKYFMTFETQGMDILLAYQYLNDSLFRKFFYFYDEQNNLIKTEYTDPENNLLSYHIYKYDKNNNLIRALSYLKNDKIYKDVKYIYNEFNKISVIDVKDYSEEEFVRKQYIVIEYNIEGKVISQTDYDTFFLMFKPPVGKATKVSLKRYFMRNPDILEYEFITEKKDYTAYTVLHKKISPKDVTEKLLFSLRNIGEIRDTKHIEYTNRNIIKFLR